MNRNIFIFIFVFFSVSACVPTHKETILQGKEDSEKNPPYNQAVRTFQVKDYVYTLRPDDIISIKVSSTTPSEFDFFNTQSEGTLTGFNPSDPMLGGFKIEEDGTITLPVVGKVELAGLTVEEARKKVTEIVDEYLDSPIVHLNLLSFQYTVLGEVKSQGRYTTYNPTLTVLQAFGEAGGFTDYANREKVKIVRRENDEVKIAYVNVLDDGLLSSPYYYLYPGDVISVPPLGAKNWRQNNFANVGIIFSGISALSILLWRLNVGGN